MNDERELCNTCGAHRRLDEKRMCYKCAVDPVRVELSALRKRDKEQEVALRDLRDRLSRRNSLVKDFRKILRQRHLPIENFDGLSEHDRDVLVSVLIDACYENGEDAELLALLDKLRTPGVHSGKLGGVVSEESSEQECGRLGGTLTG